MPSAPVLDPHIDLGHLNPEFVGLDVRLEPCQPNSAWDLFVSDQLGGHPEQSSCYAEAKKLSHWQPWLLQVYRRGEILGGSVILRQQIGPLQFAYVSHGPVCKGDDWVARATIAAIEQAGRRFRCSYFALVPPFHGEHVAAALDRQSWTLKPDFLPPSNVTVATLLIDLRPDLDTLLANMRTTTRQRVRRSLKEGVEVIQPGGEALDRFWAMLASLCARRGVKPIPPTVQTFKDLWRTMGPAGHVRLFLARFGGEDVCGAFAFSFGRTFKVWKVGWTGAHRTQCPNYALWWECIRWAKLNGFAEFDFVQIKPDHAAAIQRGETVDDGYWGVTDFKLGFGGDLAFSSPARYKSFREPFRTALKWGGSRVLASGWVCRLLRATHRQKFYAP